MKRPHIIYYCVLLALVLVFITFTATKFPYTYITMEGDDFWALTKDFWHLKLATLPAATMWLSDFLMQFYSSPWLAATIAALPLAAIGLLAPALSPAPSHNTPLRSRKRTNAPSAAWQYAALLPPVLLGFFCPFSLSFHLQWLFFFLLLLTSKGIPNLKWKTAFSLLCIPLGFLLMRTPLIALLLFCQTFMVFKTFGAKKCLYMLPAFVLLGIAPLAYSQQLAFIPFEERYTDIGTRFDPLTSRYSQSGEHIKKMACLANEERWQELLYKAQAKSEARRGNAVALRYALLAESALGTLPDNLLDYPISDENLFLFQHQTEYVALQFNRLFYLNLGIFDEAYHHAQEYGLLQTNGICFSSLRQMVEYSIEEGDWEIAEKFLLVLSKSTCHRKFIEEARQKIEKAKGEFKKDIQLRADNFVGGYPLPVEMLRLARYYKDSPHRKKMVDYAICSYIIRGDRQSFVIAVQAFDFYRDKPLPKAYSVMANEH